MRIETNATQNSRMDAFFKVDQGIERRYVTSRDEPQPKLSPAIMIGYFVFIDPSSTALSQ